MVNDVDTCIKEWMECHRHRHHLTNQRLLQLFLLEVPLEFIAIGILGPVPKTKISNVFIVLIRDIFKIEVGDLD